MTPLDNPLYRLKSTFTTSLYGLPISLSVGLDVTKTFGASVVPKALITLFFVSILMDSIIVLLPYTLNPAQERSDAEPCHIDLY